MKRGVLIVENDAGYLEDLKETVTTLFDEDICASKTLVSDALATIEDGKVMRGIGLALVDLELTGGAGTGPEDLEGRDEILPALRKHAPWVAVVAVSRYLTGDPLILADVTPYGFDAVLPKAFFSEGRTYRREWQNIRRLVSANRVAALTGRETQGVLKLLDAELALDGGSGVRAEVDKYGGERGNGWEDFVTVLKLMDFQTERVVLDEIVQGFSGLSVAKMTCRRGGTRTRWLLKFGSRLGKLSREIGSHRKMFVEGLTRKTSVPCLWWQPVVWGELGMIAYEFEERTRTLLEVARERGLGAVVPLATSALAQLYLGGEKEAIVPRTVLRKIVKPVEAGGLGGEGGSMIAALLREDPDPSLDTSVEVLVGSQHGDLHARNLLVRDDSECLLIDFAHYTPGNDGGVPLVDIAKLWVDLWAFTGDLSVEDLIGGEALDCEPTAKLCEPALVGGEASDDERKLFRMAALCYLSVYRNYPDVPSERKVQADRLFT